MTMRNKNIKLIIKVLFLCSFLFFATAEGDSDTAISFTGSQENVIENEPTTKSPLRDKHLLIIPSMFPPNLIVTRNAIGHVIQVSGVVAMILNQLARTLHFTFEYYNDTDLPTFFENRGPNKPGTITLFKDHQRADIMVGAFGYTEERNRLMDYPYPLAKDAMALMIPRPKIQKNNFVVAVWKPFQPKVWLYLGISSVVGVFSLYLVGRFLSKLKAHLEVAKTSTSEYTRFELAAAFIFGLILVQGRRSTNGGNNRQLAIRFFTGAWCLACFVLITAYSSVVTSFITAPDGYTPLVNSVYDLATKHNVRVTVNKGWSADIIFQSAATGDAKNDAGILKYLGEELKSHPEQRCAKTEQCLDQVRKSPSVFILTENFILNIIGEDWKKTNRCDFTVAKEKFLLALGSGFLLKKDSPYTQQFSLELMRMEAAGLFPVWWKEFSSDSTYCMKKIQQETEAKGVKNDKKPLTLKGLSGAFLVLGVGISLAIAAFIVEMAHYRIKHRYLTPVRVFKAGI